MRWIERILDVQWIVRRPMNAVKASPASLILAKDGRNLRIRIVGGDIFRPFIGYTIERRLGRKPVAVAFSVEIGRALRQFPQGVTEDGYLISGLGAGRAAAPVQ